MSDSEKDRWLFRIEDILHSAERIVRALENIDYEVFSDDEDLQDIVDRRFQIIGEAARKVPEDVQARYADIPWSKMIGLRNFVVHEYKKIDRRAIWETAKRSVPQIIDPLKLLLANKGQ